MAQSFQRQAVMMENGTQLYLTPEEIQRHVIGRQVYQHQIGLPVSHQAQASVQFHGHTGTIAANGSIRQYLPAQSHASMVQPTNSVDPQSADNVLSIKRQAESPPGDAAGKKAKQAGKKPSKQHLMLGEAYSCRTAPEDHQRQAIEMANRAAQHIPVQPGMPQMPGQMHQLVRLPLQVCQAHLDNDLWPYDARSGCYTQFQRSRTAVRPKPSGLYSSADLELAYASHSHSSNASE